MATTEETLSLYEELFSKRFTNEDSEFMKTVNKSQASPPCITEWISSGYRDSRSHGHNSDSRSHDRPRHDSGRDYGRRYGDRYGSDRHGSYNRDDRYMYGGRHPDRRDDRSHRGYDDRGDRQKPATEYGSRGFYEYFY